MTKLQAFEASLSGAAPPVGADLALQALWFAGNGDWDGAHGCVQQREGTPRCDWVHGYLHRQEGDVANARYWYGRAGRPVPASTAEEEWAAIATDLLKDDGDEGERAS